MLSNPLPSATRWMIELLGMLFLPTAPQEPRSRAALKSPTPLQLFESARLVPSRKRIHERHAVVECDRFTVL